MSKQFENLCSPLKIGGITIKNRFCAAPVTTGFYLGAKGEYSKDGIEYWVRRAQGGFGLIYSGAHIVDTEVDPYKAGGPTMIENPAAFRKAGIELNSRLRPYGAHMFVQLSMGLGRNYPGLHAPSELPVYGAPDKTSPVLTTEQIKTKISKVVRASAIVKASGFSGVEIHAIHWGYLLDQFAMELTNQRTDEYGGSLENRLRAAKEIVQGIKMVCGPNFPVTIRLGLQTFIKDFGKATLTGEEEAGRTLEEGIKIAKLLESYGYDALNVDTGVYDSFYYACPPMYLKRGYMIELAEACKKEVHIPVLVGSRMSDPYQSEKAIQEGKLDAVVLGRPALADPDYPKKIMMGKAEKIRPCIACNQGCHYRTLTLGIQAGCAVNPEIGHDASYRVTPALQKKKVIVVGGGVAGMEAARTSALRGHDVTLIEKSDTLGGLLIPAGKHDFKVEVRELNAWYQQELTSLHVDIRMNEEATAEKIQELNGDAVILATGSTAIIPPLPGMDHDKTVTCIEALNETKPVGDKVVIVGGGLVGCELALEYIQKGKDVTIVEAMDAILSSGEGVPVPNKQMLNDYFEHYQTPILTGHKLESVNDQGAVIVSSDGEDKKTLEADTVVIAVGFRPNPSFAQDLYETGIEVYQIGDGNKVGNILTAIWDGYEVAHSL